MSNWNPYIITDKGRKLLAETGVLNNALTFLDLRTSSHVYTSDQIPALTELEDTQGTFPFTAKETVNETSVKLEAIVSNKNVTAAYQWNSTGVYANDSNGTPVLFAVATAKAPVDMQPIASSSLSQYTLTLYLQASNTDKIQIFVDMNAYVTRLEMEQFRNTVNHDFDNIEKRIYNTIYPVGRTILDFGDTDPNAQFPWMTWIKIGEGSALISAGETYKVGTWVGANSKPIPVQCLPNHKHDASMDAQGNHTHSGSTSWAGNHRHRFWLDGRWQNHDDDGENLNDVNHGGHGQEPCWTSTSGNHTHTISLNSAGSHQHNITIAAAGDGAAFDVMQQSLPVWVWKRTA
mgnify:CR=1 FL=1